MWQDIDESWYSHKTQAGISIIHTYSSNLNNYIDLISLKEKFGGHGFTHILKAAVPKMLSKGITQDQIYKILVENPAKFLSYKSK